VPRVPAAACRRVLRRCRLPVSAGALRAGAGAARIDKGAAEAEGQERDERGDSGGARRHEGGCGRRAPRGQTVRGTAGTGRGGGIIESRKRMVDGAVTSRACSAGGGRWFQRGQTPALRTKGICGNYIAERYIKFDELYQLAADRGGAGYIFTGEHDADVMHNSATINLNMVEAARNRGIKKCFIKT